MSVEEKETLKYVFIKILIISIFNYLVLLKLELIKVQKQKINMLICYPRITLVESQVLEELLVAVRIVGIIPCHKP